MRRTPEEKTEGKFIGGGEPSFRKVSTVRAASVALNTIWPVTAPENLSDGEI
jgi:hypothetical protein